MEKYITLFIIIIIILVIFLVVSIYKLWQCRQLNQPENYTELYGYNPGMNFPNPPTPTNVQKFKDVRYICTFRYFSYKKDKQGVKIYTVSNNHPNFAQEFVQHELPKIKAPFKVIFCHGDCPVSMLWDSISKIVESKYLVNIYSVNADLPHEHIHPIPIGLDYHTHFFSKHEQPIVQEQQLIRIRDKLIPTDQRPLRIYSNAHLNKTDEPPIGAPLHNFPGGRARLQTLCDKNPLVYFEPSLIPRQKVWEKHGEYLFILSPPGNGLDCHRTWEAMILGSIPILIHTPLDPLYEDLPVVFVQQWEDMKDITEKRLQEWKEQILHKKINLKKLEEKYWTEFVSS
jgi:hypothetical protein